MDTVREIFDSLRRHLRDRIANPLYAAYAFAWAVLNFRLLLVLLGDGQWRDKIQYIDGTLYRDHSERFYRGFLHPVLIAVAFVLAAPFIQRWISVFLRGREKVTTEQLLAIAGETPLSPEAADALRGGLLKEKHNRLEERRAFETQISELSAQIDLLNTRLSKADERVLSASAPEEDVEPGPASDQLEDPQGTLTVHEADLIGVPQQVRIKVGMSGITRQQAQALYIVRNGDPFRVSDLARNLGLSENYAVQVLMDKLRGLGLISFENGISKITSAGRQALDAVISRGFEPAHEP